MEFVNHTGFPAQDFAGIDQHGQAFYVIALRQTLEWDDDGNLGYAERQEPLCESDESWGDLYVSSVRQESDYCHFKPKCDVLVNATAYAPGGVPTPAFSVHMQVRLADALATMPPPPQGLNQFMSPTPEALQEWRDSLPEGPVHGDVLIDKELRVFGPRQFRRRNVAARFANLLARVATLGMATPSPWMLTRPTPTLSVPLRLELAFGGECRVSADHATAQRVPAKHRITEEQARMHSVLDEQFKRSTVAYASFETNPLGRGYAAPWFLKLNNAHHVPAPQIELPHSPVSERDFDDCLRGKDGIDLVSRVCGGFGVIPKFHPQRIDLGGTIDDSFIMSDEWLPDDFSFAVWNAAAPDQQTHFLKGGEVIELTNMCPAGTQGTSVDAAGNTVLTLTLPTNECYVVIRLQSGEFFSHPMGIDTVIVEPDERRLSIVWRTVLARDEEVEVRAVEAMCRTHAERDNQRQEIEGYKALIDLPAAHSDGKRNG